MLVAGGALGLLGAAWAIDALVPLLPAGHAARRERRPAPAGAAVHRRRRSALIALCVGVWPALEASRGGLSASVSDLSRGNTGVARRARARAIVLVVAPDRGDAVAGRSARRC